MLPSYCARFLSDGVRRQGHEFRYALGIPQLTIRAKLSRRRCLLRLRQQARPLPNLPSPPATTAAISATWSSVKTGETNTALQRSKHALLHQHFGVLFHCRKIHYLCLDAYCTCCRSAFEIQEERGICQHTTCKACRLLVAPTCNSCPVPVKKKCLRKYHLCIAKHYNKDVMLVGGHAFRLSVLGKYYVNNLCQHWLGHSEFYTLHHCGSLYSYRYLTKSACNGLLIHNIVPYSNILCRLIEVAALWR